MAAAQKELSVLEARFIDACVRSTESKDARMIDLEARFLHSSDVVSTPAIDAFIMQSCQPLWDPDNTQGKNSAPAPVPMPMPMLLPPSLGDPLARRAAAEAASPSAPARSAAPPHPHPHPAVAAVRLPPPPHGAPPYGAPPPRPLAAAEMRALSAFRGAPMAPPHGVALAYPDAAARAPRPQPTTYSAAAAPPPRGPGSRPGHAAAAPPRGALRQFPPSPADQTRNAFLTRVARPPPAPAPPAPTPNPARTMADDTASGLLLGFVQSLHRSDSHSELVDFVEDVRTKTADVRP